jgi:hypothetical protein
MQITPVLLRAMPSFRQPYRQADLLRELAGLSSADDAAALPAPRRIRESSKAAVIADQVARSAGHTASISADLPRSVSTTPSSLRSPNASCPEFRRLLSRLLASELVVAGPRWRENLRKPPQVLPVTEFWPASQCGS